MAQEYKVRKIHGMPAKKAYAIFRVADLVGVESPIDVDDDVRPVMANMTSAEAQSYARMLNSGKSLSSVKEQRQYYRNMMYSGMN